LDETDLPTGINANKIGTGVVSTTEFEYLNGVTSAIQTQIDGKQATLVSGTNIKTINGATVLGAGDLTITGNPPSGVSGAIQFTNGSAFASDATNLFWDDTNNRLGVGTDTPQTAGHFRTSGSTRGVLSVVNANDISNYGSRVQLYNKQSGDPVVDGANGFALIYTDSTKSSFVYNYSDGPMIFGTAATERMRLNNNGGLTIKGSGTTSGTTALLVQNSSGTELFKVQDNGSGTFGFAVQAASLTATANINFGNIFYGNSFWSQNDGGTTIGQQAAPVASAILDIRSTTRGFLPPRMTTTQKNAIASPAAGLVVYDSTTNKLCCYNGSTWNDLF
jgi:hypothetical protein